MYAAIVHASGPYRSERVARAAALLVLDPERLAVTEALGGVVLRGHISTRSRCHLLSSRRHSEHLLSCGRPVACSAFCVSIRTDVPVKQVS